jgi:lipid-A-disaccharide synthase-like uncharacterized protein
MIDDWREWLYPLGFLASIAFSSRMLLQWLTSEVKGRSIVMPTFWKLSLCGNLLLAMHSLIQVQYHVCLIQTCNAVISWRNLNLMKSVKQQISLIKTVKIFIASVAFITTIFWIDGYLFLENKANWFRIPSNPWQDNANLKIPFFWHLIGFIGLALFSSRFWIQWWCAEKQRKSYLSRSFWWISLIGESLCLIYFLKIHDPVNSIGPACGLIPYVRNLMLIYKKQPIDVFTKNSPQVEQ